MLVRPRRITRSTRLGLTAVLAVTFLTATATPRAATETAEAAAGATSRFAALDTQIRVLDTRQPGSPVPRQPSHGVFSIDPVTAAVAASAGVDESQIVAVVANVTLDSADGWGFVTVYPAGAARPDSSSINTDTAGQTVANMVTARLGAGGQITIYTSVGTDVIVDIQGVYVSASSSQSGRLVVVPPARAVDTRPAGRLAAGEILPVDLRPAGVPATASAAVLNVTAVEAGGWGFLTVWDGVGAPPNASNVNYVAGSNVANQVIVETDGGLIGVYTFASTHLLVDVVGYMTGPSDASSTEGLFVALAPGRLFDSRLGVAPTFSEPIDGGATLSVGALGEAGVPLSGVLAINTNTTMTETTASGFATVWGDGAVPVPSSLNNIGADRTVANHVVTDITGTGCVNMYASATADMIIDVTGYFVGSVAGSLFAPLDLCDGTLAPPGPQPGSPPSSGPHDFLFVNPAAPPPGYGRWDSCRPERVIRYAVNPLRATQLEIDEMHRALREIERATGFDFVPYQADPTTTVGLDDDDGDDARKPPPGADFLIGFGDDVAMPTKLGGGVIGIGGGRWYPTTGEIATGYAIVDVPDLGSANSLRAALTHELAHAMGLGHVGDDGQLMFPAFTGVATFGPGDREGLWRVGTAQPCTPTARPGASELPVLVESETR